MITKIVYLLYNKAKQLFNILHKYNLFDKMFT